MPHFVSPDGVVVRPYDAAADLDWAGTILDEEFAGRLQARRGVLMDPLAGDGLVAESSGMRTGLLTWLIDRDAGQAEIRLLIVVAAARGRGVGSLLLERAAGALAAAGCRRAWLVTTNDAIDALAFYQRRGFRLVELRPGAVDLARESIKPTIGLIGASGIPIRDELELAREI